MGGSSEQLERQILDCLQGGVLVLRLEDPSDDDSLVLAYANVACERLLGFDLKAQVGTRITDLLPRIPSARRAIYAAACREPMQRDLGEVVYGDHRVSSATYGISVRSLGERTAVVMFEQLDALKLAAAEARTATQFLDSLVEQVPAMIFLKSASDLRFERFNRAGEELLGLSRTELLGKSDYDFFPKAQADFFVSKDRDVLASKALREIPEEPIETPRGTRWLHTRKIPLLDEKGEPRHLLGISVDITERKQAAEVLRLTNDELARRVAERTRELEQQVDETQRAQEALARTEEQLRHSQKMEAIGRLAGGIAHDFNNLLSVVLGYSDVALDDLSPRDRLRPVLEQIRTAGLRAAELTSQLLAFSRQQVMRPRVFDLNEVVRGMRGMLSRLVGEDVELSIQTSDELAEVKADPHRIEQVLMNLVVNARDAMPTGGQLTIETRHVALDERYAAEHLGAQAGPHVLLAVSDTGGGMDKATLARIFEPFFTTKEQGKGTGLGLSTVLGIVQQSGGSIWVYSEPGRGSTFKVYLPVADEALDEAVAHEPSAVSLRGRETVLLAEDDAQVRALAADVLRQHGYEVIEAKNGRDAERIGEAPGFHFDLLLTDVVMPELGGRALAESLRARRPQLRVLFMSGYTDDAVLRHGVLEPDAGFVQKPLTPNALLCAVRATLDGTPG